MRAGLELSEAENEADALRLVAMLDAIATAARCRWWRACTAHALGGGAGLVCAADIAVASDTLRIGFTEVRLGIIPAAISPFVVRRIGAGHARALFLRGCAIIARRRRSGSGSCTASRPSTSLDAAVEPWSADLLAGGPRRWPRRSCCWTRCRRRPPPGPGRRRRGGSPGSRVRDEAQAGIRAFLERETPPWR